jgi:hypothetical protein
MVYRRSFAGPYAGSIALWKTGPVLLFALSIAVSQLCAREKDGIQYGAGFIVNLPFPESEVAQVVQDLVQDGIIRGTKEYNKDEYVAGATAESSVHVFPAWTEGGKVFYKVRLHALDPRNFKDSGDVGTLAVRYVVQSQGENNTVLRINAVFVEEFRHTVHPSNGSVETAEYKDIHDRLDAISSMKSQAAEAEQERQQQLARKLDVAPPQPPTTATANLEDAVSTKQDVVAPEVPQTLEEHVKDLRLQVERLVKSPGAALKSAPFHTASTLQSLPTGTEVLIVISTPYWVGVETHEGQHGWILRDELEQLP